MLKVWLVSFLLYLCPMKTTIIISNWKVKSSNTEYTTDNPSYKKIFKIMNKGGLGFSEVCEDYDSKGYDNVNETYHIVLSDNPTPEQYESINKLKNVTIINN